MSMVDLEELMPGVLKFAPSAPEPAVMRELRDAARAFCKRTKLWREEDAFTVAAPSYEGLITFAEAEIVEIEAAELEGTTLEPATIVDLDNLYPGWRRDTDEGSARYVTQMQLNSISIYPRQSGELELGLILMPSLTATTVPAWLVSQFSTEIGRGAAGELLITPNTEYFNAQVGGALIEEFKRDFVPRQAVKARKGQQRARLRSKPSFF